MGLFLGDLLAGGSVAPKLGALLALGPILGRPLGRGLAVGSSLGALVGLTVRL